MRAAPPVSVRGNGGPVWRAVQALLPALATAVVLFWSLSLAEAAATSTLVAVSGTAAMAVGLLTWRLLDRPAWQLSWGGQHWTLHDAPHAQARTPPGAQGQLEVMVDLGSFMLLRLVPASGRHRWTAITAHEAGAHWHGLRAAAYARPSPQAANADEARGTTAELRPPEAVR